MLYIHRYYRLDAWYCVVLDSHYKFVNINVSLLWPFIHMFDKAGPSALSCECKEFNPRP
jgi:hypothetical protein